MQGILAAPMSNYLYRSDIISSVDKATGYFEPLLSSQHPIPGHDVLPNVYEELIAKPKLTVILDQHFLNLDQHFLPSSPLRLVIWLRWSSKKLWKSQERRHHLDRYC